jgi:hypothetical protein
MEREGIPGAGIKAAKIKFLKGGNLKQLPE